MRLTGTWPLRRNASSALASVTVTRQTLTSLSRRKKDQPEALLRPGKPISFQFWFEKSKKSKISKHEIGECFKRF